MLRESAAAGILALSVSNALANMSYDEFDKNRQNVAYLTYIDGLSTGAMWANVNADIEGHPLYCPPLYLAIEREQYISILDHYVADQIHRTPTSRQDDIGMLMIGALKSALPCATK